MDQVTTNEETEGKKAKRSTYLMKTVSYSCSKILVIIKVIKIIIIIINDNIIINTTLIIINNKKIQRQI